MTLSALGGHWGNVETGADPSKGVRDRERGIENILFQLITKAAQ